MIRSLARLAGRPRVVGGLIEVDSDAHPVAVAGRPAAIGELDAAPLEFGLYLNQALAPWLNFSSLESGNGFKSQTGCAR